MRKCRITLRIITRKRDGQAATAKNLMLFYYIMTRCWKNWTQRIKYNIPPLDYIRKIYQGLANYLQVPLGTEQVGYAFDLNDFLKKFSFQSKPAQAALQVLQQEGFITLNDPVFTPGHTYILL